MCHANVSQADVADLTEEGTVEFHFVSGGHKHTFQTSTLGERDNWVAVLKTKIEEAKALADTVKETEEYKKAHTSLTKPVVAVAKKVEEPKKTEETTPAVVEPTPAAEETTPTVVEPVVEKKEEKKSRKSRSASRKRTSIFGGIGFGNKKEEKVEASKEEATPAPATEETTQAALAEPTSETPAVTEPVVPATSTEEPSTETAKPTPTKRNSIFGTLKSQFSQSKEKKSDGPVVPAKDEAEPVSETAPVIPQVESTEPLASEPVAEAPAATTEAPVTNGEAKTETPTVKADKRKSSLPWLTKKEKPTSDDEAEKPKSPFAKLRATVKGKSSPKAEKVEKAPEATKEEESTPVAPVVEESTTTPAPVVPATTPQVTASA